MLSLGMAADRLHPVQLAEHLGLLEHVHHVRKLIPHEPLARLLVPADAAQQLHVCSLGVASTHHEQCNATGSLVSAVVDASGESGIRDQNHVIGGELLETSQVSVVGVSDSPGDLGGDLTGVVDELCEALGGSEEPLD